MTTVRDVSLHLIELPLVRPFRTSFGTESVKECVLVRVETDEGVGWGECVAGRRPDYSGEFNDAAWIALREHLAPAVLGNDIVPTDVARLTAWVRGNRMAKAALEMAVLDAWLREQGVSLARHLGVERDRVPCGVSIGITPSVEELLEQVEAYLAEGYRRIKLKIEPGTDVERVAAVRDAHPDTPLSVDANAAYTIDDADAIRALEPFDLLMIEQPLAYDDIAQHAKLQRTLRTSLCLDESIRSAADAAAALELGACRILNIKQGRVGGLLEAQRIHDLALAQDVPVWCGGMLETGIGRAANLALAALPGFTLPGDTSGSGRYFRADITDAFVLDPDGTMAVPQGPGIGLEPLPERLADATVRTERVVP